MVCLLKEIDNVASEDGDERSTATINPMSTTVAFEVGLSYRYAIVIIKKLSSTSLVLLVFGSMGTYGEIDLGITISWQF